MTTVKTISTSLAPPSALSPTTGPARRLVVLIPGVQTDHTPVVHKVWELARSLECDVLFLGLCRAAAEEPALRRALITMAASVRDEQVSAEGRVEIGNDWIKVVKSHQREGDLIVCFAEQRTGLLHRPLNQILRSNLETPIYILSDLYSQNQSRFNMLSFITLWGGLISIIAGSFLLQIRLGPIPRDGTQTILMILSVLAEFWLIWVWNNVFS